MPRGHLIWAAYMQEKYLCMNLGVKEGGRAFARRGHIFTGTYSTPYQQPMCIQSVSREKQENAIHHTR